MKQEVYKKCMFCKTVFFICLITSLGLIIGGFIVPPMGIIDGSVLTAVGELIVFPALAFGFKSIELGYDLRVSKGDASLEINNNNENSSDQ